MRIRSVLSWMAVILIANQVSFARAASSPFSDDQAMCSSFSDRISRAQRKIIAATQSKHMIRLHHLLWHTTRTSWNDFTAEDQAAILELSPEWSKNAPVCPPPSSRMRFRNYNASGEEFLMMHHMMIDFLRQKLVSAGLSCINGWTAPPLDNDPLWPVPPGTSDDSSKSAQTGRLLQSWSSVFLSSKWLRGKSLSYVGYLVEWSIHNNMHARWATIPTDADQASPLDASPLTADGLMAPSKYDNPKYNWLGTFWSSHVNPIFWKLHGLVDHIIEAWLSANGYTEIAMNCGGRPTCYQWKSAWLGGDMGMDSMNNMSGELSLNDTIVQEIVRKNRINTGFRNAKFDRFLLMQSKSTSRRKADPLADPAVYVNQFGPCSN